MGGLMGLCMGFSLLSFVDVTILKCPNSTVFPKCFYVLYFQCLYWFCIRWGILIMKRKKQKEEGTFQVQVNLILNILAKIMYFCAKLGERSGATGQHQQEH